VRLGNACGSEGPGPAMIERRSSRLGRAVDWNDWEPGRWAAGFAAAKLYSRGRLRRRGWCDSARTDGAAPATSRTAVAACRTRPSPAAARAGGGRVTERLGRASAGNGRAEIEPPRKVGRWERLPTGTMGGCSSGGQALLAWTAPASRVVRRRTDRPRRRPPRRAPPRRVPRPGPFTSGSPSGGGRVTESELRRPTDTTPATTHRTSLSAPGQARTIALRLRARIRVTALRRALTPALPHARPTSPASGRSPGRRPAPRAAAGTSPSSRARR
jgi:hypothetical protein